MRLGQKLHKALCTITDTVMAPSVDAEHQLYDDFSARRLDEAKWYGAQTGTGGPGGIELVRRIKTNPRRVRRYSGMGESDTGMRYLMAGADSG